MKEYLQKILEISEKIANISTLSLEFYNHDSALASIIDADKLADELKEITKKALEPPF